MKLYSWKIGFYLLGCSVAQAGGTGISFDGSMGPAAALTGPNYTIPANMGTQVGGNLFHSFGQFNLLNGETANFTATGSTGSINNIIARVTGGSASSIDGTIESSIAGANLYLLNPSGVMFGANAKVSVTGAFTVGTPDYVKMSDGVGIFHTSLGGNDVLSSAPVSAFGFLSSTPSPVQFSQSKLSFATGSNFNVIGGDITVDGAAVTAPGGNVSFFSAASSGELPFDPAHPSASFNTSTVTGFGNVTLQNSSKVAIDSAQGGGSVVIRGGKMVLQNTSTITSRNSGKNAGGNISVTSDSLSITSGASMAADTLAGNAGQISVQTGSLTIDGSADIHHFTGISSNSDHGATGNGGDISVTATGAVSIQGAGYIAADTSSSGNAGQVVLQANSLNIDGTAAVGAFTGIASDTLTGATGNGGSISLTVNNGIVIVATGTIAADTSSAGDAGAIVAKAGSLMIDGSATLANFTGIATAAKPGSKGNGGNIDLAITNGITILANGVIDADTSSSGPAGTINVQAGSMTIDGTIDPNVLTGIGSNADPMSSGVGGVVNVNIANNLTCTGGAGIDSQAFSTNRGGDVNVTASSVKITDGGYVDADTYASGNGGKVNLIAQSIFIDGSGPAGVGYPTGINSDSSSYYKPDATGNGGDVVVTATQSLTIVNGGTISASTETLGNGGNVIVNAPNSVSLSDGSEISSVSSGVGTLTIGAGTAGNVTVTTKTLDLTNGSSLAAAATNADAGSILIKVNQASLSKGSTINATAGVNGGSVYLDAAKIVYLLNSEISAAANHIGGDVTIDPEYLVMNDSTMSSDGLSYSFVGEAGRFSIVTDYFFANASSINGVETISNTLVPGLRPGLVVVPENGENKLRESCARSIKHEFSSLIVVGRGGTETAPEELQPDFGISSGPGPR